MDRRRAIGGARGVLLAAMLVPGMLALGACGPDQTAATPLQLRDLVRFASRYDGQRVRTTGVVHTLAEPRHYWIQTSDDDRVTVRPNDKVSSLTGQRVRVIGRFSYSRSKGRAIVVDEVTALAQGSAD